MAFLNLTGLHKTYEGAPLLCGVSFEVDRGDLACLLGPSGSGKTTLLRIVAGLEQPDAGRVYLDSQDITALPSYRRGVVLMFQDYALFPHRTVAENIAFGLRMRHESHQAIAARVAEMLDLLHLGGLERRSVVDLSGGERQRVALARSLAPSPRLLLLDEPLAALDRNLRERLLEELPAILRQVGVTALMVTHDQEEAFAMADQVILLHGGQVVQAGAPQAVYDAPATLWAARFLGARNLLPAISTAHGEVQTPIGVLKLAPDAVPPLPEARGTLMVHPWGIDLDPDPEASNPFRGTLVQRTFHGSRYASSIRVVDEILVVEDSGRGEGLAVGEAVEGALDPASLRWLPESVEEASACDKGE